MKKLAIITSHPIQYNAPLFKKLAERKNIDIKVFYTWSQSEDGVFDKEFNKNIKWDIPLLTGYDSEFILNTSRKPNSRHFQGIICPTLIETVERWNPNAILIYGWAFNAHLKVLRYFKGKIPIIFRGDSTLLDEKFGIKKVFRKILLKYIYNFVDYAFFVGTYNKEYFLKAGLKDKQLFFLPYTIDEKHYQDNDNKRYEEKAMRIREQLGIKQGDKTVAFIGKFIKKKNPIFLLKAIQKYNLQNKFEVKLLFIGSGKQEAFLRKLAKNDKNIFFISFINQKEMPIAYRFANVFVLPSKGPQETWGVSVNESLACNRFVLVSNKVGSAIDLVKNNENGEVFKSNSCNSFIDKLGIILNKKSFNKQDNTNPFNLEKAALTVENIINRL